MLNKNEENDEETVIPQYQLLVILKKHIKTKKIHQINYFYNNLSSTHIEVI